MNMEQLKYRILKVIESGKKLNVQDFGVDQELYYNAIQEIHEEELAANITLVSKGTGLFAFTSEARIKSIGRKFIKDYEEQF